jgi:hypothetical protein
LRLAFNYAVSLVPFSPARFFSFMAEKSPSYQLEQF